MQKMIIDISNYKKLPRIKLIWDNLSEDEKQKFELWDSLITMTPFPAEKLESLRNEIRNLLIRFKDTASESLSDFILEYPEFFKEGKLYQKIQPTSPLDEGWPDVSSPILQRTASMNDVSERNTLFEKITDDRYKIPAYRYSMWAIREIYSKVNEHPEMREVCLEFLLKVDESIWFVNECPDREKLVLPDLLKNWGIYSSKDIGIICERLLQMGFLKKDEGDTDIIKNSEGVFNLEKDGSEEIKSLITNWKDEKVKMILERFNKQIHSSLLEERENAINLLSDIDEKSAVPLLINILKIDDPETFSQKALAVRNIYCTRKLEDKIKSNLLTQFIKCLKTESSEIRKSVIDTLEFMDADIDTQPVSIKSFMTPYLIDAIRDGNGNTQEAAITVLGKLKDPSLLSVFQQAFKNENEEVRWASAQALAKLKDKSIIPYLVENIQKDGNVYSNWELRKSSADMLGEIGDKSVLPFLREQVQHVEGYCRITVEKAIVSAIKKIENENN